MAFPGVSHYVVCIPVMMVGVSVRPCRAGGMLWAILCIPASLVDGSGRDVLNSYKRRRGISGGMVDRRLL